MKVKFKLSVLPGGDWKFFDRELWRRYRSGLKPGVYYLPQLEPETEKRRHLGQNNLYWLRNKVLADYTGDTKEDMHEIIMERCGHTRRIERFGRSHKLRLSSADLTEAVFSLLIKEQDEIARYINDGIQNAALILPSGDILEMT